jgi:hypothetical protein
VLASHHDEPDEDAGANEEEDEGDRGVTDMGKELTQAVSSKASAAKGAASRKLKPEGEKLSSLGGAWEAASPYLLPFAKEAATSLGETVAKKAPDLVKDELMPRFIAGFEKES